HRGARRPGLPRRSAGAPGAAARSCRQRGRGGGGQRRPGVRRRWRVGEERLAVPARRRGVERGRRRAVHRRHQEPAHPPRAADLRRRPAVKVSRRARWSAVWLLSLAALPAAAQPAGEAGIQLFRLANGLAVVVAVRPELRLAAVNLTAAVGAIDDPRQQSGMAHLLEHVTLGGSVSIGTLDAAAEKEALARLDRADRAWREERHKSPADPQRLAELEGEREQAHQAARRVAESGEIIGGRLEGKGAIGLNATTNSDATQYFGWIPTGQLELWISLEAERLKNPIFRRFYSEREVVLQEIDALTRGRPTLQDRLMSDVYPDGPQAEPRAGDPAEIRDIDRPMALDYFHRFYRPENLAIAVVGNVDPAEVRRLCERYLGDWRPEGATEPLARPSQGTAAAARVRSFNSVRAPIVFFAFPQPALSLGEKAGLEVLAELLNSTELSP